MLLVDYWQVYSVGLPLLANLNSSLLRGPIEKLGFSFERPKKQEHWDFAPDDFAFLFLVRTSV